jgi:hypothetical protein
LPRNCQKKDLPHPGVVVIDSPLTSYKRRGAKDVKGSDSTVSSGVEAAFWESLTKIAKDVQIIIVKNKEPPATVAAAVHYEWFAGNEAEPGDRVGFIPEALGN